MKQCPHSPVGNPDHIYSIFGGHGFWIELLHCFSADSGLLTVSQFQAPLATPTETREQTKLVRQLKDLSMSMAVQVVVVHVHGCPGLGLFRSWLPRSTVALIMVVQVHSCLGPWLSTSMVTQVYGCLNHGCPGLRLLRSWLSRSVVV